MKMKFIPLIAILGLFLTSCELTNPAVTYEQKLVVFGNLTADFPMVDTLFVSRSAAIEENSDSYAMYIDDAEVTITDGDTTISVPPVPDRPGRYLADPNYFFRAGKEYRVKVVWENDTVTAKTVLPEKMEFSSEASDSYTCNGSPVTIAPVTVDNATLQLYDGQLIPVPTGPIDTVVYRTGDCYTESFASLPYFFLNFNAEDYHTVRIISFALGAETRGLEPFDDRNGNGVWDADSEPFVDYNRDGVRDSTFINLIYDTTFTSIAWKGDYLRTEQNDPYRYNPVVWAVDTSPLPMTWLYFNYYGFHLIALQATDQAYYDYFSGDPFGMNQYLLPDSNIEGGYGLFSSTYTKFFFVYIKPE